ncbi:hypothetical protein PAGU2595_029510 [Lysobacter xanthus]
MDVAIVAGAATLAGAIASHMAKIHIVSMLRDFHPQAYASAGAPKYRQIYSQNGHLNWRWIKQVWFRGFARDELSPSGLRWPYEVAWVSSWLGLLAALVFMHHFLESAGQPGS